MPGRYSIIDARAATSMKPTEYHVDWNQKEETGGSLNLMTREISGEDL